MKNDIIHRDTDGLAPFDCPVCGASILKEDEPFDDENLCEHVKLLFADVVGDFVFVDDEYEDMVDEMKQKIDEGEEDIEELLVQYISSDKGKGHTLAMLTSHGMACGPVSNTDYILIRS